MIIKSYEINKVNFNKNKLILIYGVNDGLKNEFINSLLIKLELEKMREQRTDLLLDLLFSRAEVIESNHKHTDDTLLILAKETGSRVLTVDKDLKRRFCIYWKSLTFTRILSKI